LWQAGGRQTIGVGGGGGGVLGGGVGSGVRRGAAVGALYVGGDVCADAGASADGAPLSAGLLG
jgi:hypothetical protein